MPPSNPTFIDDPMYTSQWHLSNSGAGLYDLNLVSESGTDVIWQNNSGAGINVSVNDSDSFGLSSNSHGTAVMGIIGAVENNDCEIGGELARHAKAIKRAISETATAAKTSSILGEHPKTTSPPPRREMQRLSLFLLDNGKLVKLQAFPCAHIKTMLPKF